MEYSLKQFEKLRDCVYYNPESGPNKAKFLRRANATATLLIRMANGSIVSIKRAISEIEVDGQPLKYKDRFSLTNPRNPF